MTLRRCDRKVYVVIARNTGHPHSPMTTPKIPLSTPLDVLDTQCQSHRKDIIHDNSW